METITVKQFVMLLTSQSILSTANFCESNPYKYCSPIVHIICVDGTNLSVQAHGRCHARFADVQPCYSYSPTFGRDLIMAETDCEDLDQYGIDDIDDIELYVASHGGIDIEATTANAISIALRCIKDKSKEN